MVTSKSVQRDIFNALRDSDLARGVSGRVYYDGTRPRDSRLEDIEVVFTYGTTDGQLAQGVVTILVYFNDIDPFDNGVTVEDIERAVELEALCADFVSSIRETLTQYKIGLQQAILTQEQIETSQHFVSVRLTYETIE